MAVLSWIWGIVKGVLNGIARAVVTLLILLLVLAGIAMFSGDGVGANTVLELDLRKAMDDKSNASLLDLGDGKLSIMDVVLGLDRAARDPRVKGVFLRVGSGDLSVPKAEELRDALKHFKESKKFVIAHSQSFYSGGLGDYTAATAADQIWMQPVSTFFSAGASATTMFFKGLFDKINATPQFVQRYEYKNAANVFTETDFTPAHREATLRLLQSWYDSATTEAASDRKLDRATLVSVLDAGPATVETVKDKGLITNIGYDDDARDAAKAQAGSGAAIMRFDRYAQATRNRNFGSGGASTIALVHAAGDIVEGSDDGPLGNSNSQIAGDTFSQAIRDAAADKNVKAILLRVDSPGGSAIASDQILQALKKAHAAGKPIVVSMGSVAASGGYYISVAGDRIVAEPGTITGSIGVLWGKFAVGKSLEMVGLEARELGVGKNALFLSGITPWDSTQLAAVNAQADLVYADFTQKVAAGRKLPLERVQQVARGRVWTGADAKERGLVDELGGFWVAVADVRKLAGLAPDARVTFQNYPESRGLVGAVARMLGSSAASLKALDGLNALMQSMPVKTLIDVAREMPAAGVQMRAMDLPVH
ncbi:MAG TPA: signal peptide peptidase SppA [Micropepsaceae bacterium]|jgi:protease-4|nr:signal peptide peptidase SppA [Micropepsaceae bacterium]